MIHGTSVFFLHTPFSYTHEDGPQELGGGFGKSPTPFTLLPPDLKPTLKPLDDDDEEDPDC